MKKVKVIANYLPQYHRIPENDRWWGRGFTDWTAVRNARPLYAGHQQPRVPLGRSYYSLDDVNAIRWQAELAKKYGVYGFGIYHYWFSSRLQLLQKPAELLLENKDIDIHFLFIWDNLTWKRTWSHLERGLDWAPDYDGKRRPSGDDGVLARLDYGSEEDWKKHYAYLSAFFRDPRYIREHNRPIFAIFQPRNDIRTLKKMAACWDELAKRDGFDGILMLSKDSVWPQRLEKKLRYAPFAPVSLPVFAEYKLRDFLAERRGQIHFFSYDECWRRILKEARAARPDAFLCGFVAYDDTPRRGRRGRIITGARPWKFERYMTQLLSISRQQHKEYVFLMAWNEWGEGAYLEPDEACRYGYLEALRRAVAAANTPVRRKGP